MMESMMERIRGMSNSRYKQEQGFTFLEILVSVFLSAIVVGSILAFLSQNNSVAHDRRVILNTEEKARAIADLIAFDLKGLGAGIPFYQGSFNIETVALGDAPYPILTTSTASRIEFRSNEYGNQYVLTSDFNPAINIAMTVLAPHGVIAGDTVYLTNVERMGSAGLKGIVSSVGVNSISIQPGYIVSPGAIFGAGSTVARVRKIKYMNQAAGAGIWRDVDDANGASLLPSPTFPIQGFYEV